MNVSATLRTAALTSATGLLLALGLAAPASATAAARACTSHHRCAPRLTITAVQMVAVNTPVSVKATLLGPDGPISGATITVWYQKTRGARLVRYADFPSGSTDRHGRVQLTSFDAGLPLAGLQVSFAGTSGYRPVRSPVRPVAYAPYVAPTVAEARSCTYRDTVFTFPDGSSQSARTYTVAISADATGGVYLVAGGDPYGVFEWFPNLQGARRSYVSGGDSALTVTVDTTPGDPLAGTVTAPAADSGAVFEGLTVAVRPLIVDDYTPAGARVSVAEAPYTYSTATCSQGGPAAAAG